MFTWQTPEHFGKCRFMFGDILQKIWPMVRGFLVKKRPIWATHPCKSPSHALLPGFNFFLLFPLQNVFPNLFQKVLDEKIKGKAWTDNLKLQTSHLCSNWSTQRLEHRPNVLRVPGSIPERALVSDFINDCHFLTEMPVGLLKKKHTHPTHTHPPPYTYLGENGKKQAENK